MSSIDEALVEAERWVTRNETLNEHHDYDKYRQRMDSPYPPVIENAFVLLLKEGYNVVLTPGREDMIASPTTEDDDVAIAEQRAAQLETYAGSFETLADAAALTIKKSKTMPKSFEYLSNGYVQVRFSVATAVHGMKIHVTTDPQQKAKMKKVLYENLLGQGGALHFCPGYGNRKDPQKNFHSLFIYVWNGIKHDNGEYDPRAMEPDFDSNEYDAYLLRKLSHTIMQEAAAAEQRVADAAAKKAKTKKENEESEAQIGLRTGAKSGSGLGGHTSSRSHSVTNAAMSFGT